MCGLVSGFAMACSDCGRIEEHGPNGKDTLSAVVMYGEHQLFDRQEALSDGELEAMVDSLITLDQPPVDLIKEIELYQQIRGLSKVQMVNLIDSLFEQDTIPYALINEINFYMSYAEVKPSDGNLYTLPWECDSEYPADHVYGMWNTKSPNCYPRTLSESDSLVLLRLTQEEQECGFHIPFDGVVTSRFGWRDGRNHNGIDIDLEVWEPVHSAFPGKVRFAGYAGGWGRLVVVRHYNGLETFYAHLHRFKVEAGDEVEAGDIVGLGGSSGHSTGSHLHFEVRYKGVPIDPSHLISWKENSLVCDTLVLQKRRWSYASYPHGTTMHTVSRGDHLHGIAERYGTSIDRLCELNGISRRKYLRVGQQLLVSSN
jgi:hypothetical protein